MGGNTGTRSGFTNQRLNPTEGAVYNLMPSHRNQLHHSRPRGLRTSSDVVGGLAAIL